jgi:hypothetical protein
MLNKIHEVLLFLLDQKESPVSFQSSETDCPHTRKRVQDDIAYERVKADYPLRQFDREDSRMQWVAGWIDSPDIGSLIFSSDSRDFPVRVAADRPVEKPRRLLSVD